MIYIYIYNISLSLYIYIYIYIYVYVYIYIYIYIYIYRMKYLPGKVCRCSGARSEVCQESAAIFLVLAREFREPGFPSSSEHFLRGFAVSANLRDVFLSSYRGTRQSPQISAKLPQQLCRQILNPGSRSSLVMAFVLGHHRHALPVSVKKHSSGEESPSEN